MFLLKRRVLILFLLWLMVAIAFAFAPIPRSDFPEHQERLRAFFMAPVLFAFGLALFVPASPTTSTLIFVFALIYQIVQLGYFLAEARRLPILNWCVAHLVLTGIAVVSFVRFTWNCVSP